MQIVEEEIPSVQVVPPGARINYNKDNPIWTLAGAIERTDLAAGRQHYLVDSLQYLLAYDDLFLAGPSGDAWEEKDPRRQENKNDFQKQNIRGYRLTGAQITRGYATAGDWRGPFVRLSYTPDVGSPLLDSDGTLRDSAILCVVQIGTSSFAELRVPYNPRTHRYEVEIWGFPGFDLRPLLDPAKGQVAIDSGELIVRADLVRGSYTDFFGTSFDDRRGQANRQGSALTLLDVAPDHALHPIRPLHITLAWGRADRSRWDSQGGANYHYEFNMPVRGWNAYLGGGISPNPHGGVGFLEFRNLFSNYFGYEAARRAALGNVPPELGRQMEPWNRDADNSKPPATQAEAFLAVDYMDLHLLRPSCGIGIHRHRDNQEVFMLLSGKGLMVMGDWCKFQGRERAFEIRTMLPGDLSLVKGGRLHALLNLLDEDITLFMFGGYD